MTIEETMNFIYAAWLFLAVASLIDVAVQFIKIYLNLKLLKIQTKKPLFFALIPFWGFNFYSAWVYDKVGEKKGFDVQMTGPLIGGALWREKLLGTKKKRIATFSILALVSFVVAINNFLAIDFQKISEISDFQNNLLFSVSFLLMTIYFIFEAISAKRDTANPFAKRLGESASPEFKRTTKFIAYFLIIGAIIFLIFAIFYNFVFSR